MKHKSLGQKFMNYSSNVGQKIYSGIKNVGQKIVDNRYKILAGVGTALAVASTGIQVADAVKNIPQILVRSAKQNVG